MKSEVWIRQSPHRRERLDLCICQYYQRKMRYSHPEGIFDSKGRWYPLEKESQDCCDRIRTPSVRYPYSLSKHCRSIEHLSNLFEIDISFLRRRVVAIRRGLAQMPAIVQSIIDNRTARLAELHRESERMGEAGYNEQIRCAVTSFPSGNTAKLPFEPNFKESDETLAGIENLIREIDKIMKS